MQDMLVSDKGSYASAIAIRFLSETNWRSLVTKMINSNHRKNRENWNRLDTAV